MADSKKKSIYELFGSDESLETKGIWHDFGDYGRFLIARAGGSNKPYAKALERETRPLRRSLEAGAIDEERSRALLAKVFADTVVLGWEGVIGRDGEELPFDRDNCRKLLTDLPNLFEDIRTQATSWAQYRKQALEAEAGE